MMELTKEQMNRVAYRIPVTIGELIDRAEIDGETTDETCPHCDHGTVIPVIGGYCMHCGKWVLPCSMCDMEACDLGVGVSCPFACLRPKEDE